MLRSRACAVCRLVISRGFFLWSSRRRSLARMATAVPFTRSMVRRFVAGDRLDDALVALERLRDHGLTWTVDVLGESVNSREMALASADRYIATLDALAERDLEANVSLKPTQMGLDIDRDFCLGNIGRVVERARQIGAFVRLDMEDHTKTDVTLGMVRELHERHVEVGAVIQSYLRRSEADIEALNRDQIRVRLCKGAYDEPATVAFKSRDEVDESYRVLMERLMLDGRYPALATHDEQLIELALAFAREKEISPDRYEFQMLYGVRRDLQERLTAIGQTVRVYVPYGTRVVSVLHAPTGRAPAERRCRSSAASCARAAARSGSGEPVLDLPRVIERVPRRAPDRIACRPTLAATRPHLGQLAA